MLTTQFLAEKFSHAQPYDAYLASGTLEHQRRWKQVYDASQLNENQVLLVTSFIRQMNVLIVSGTWCGDCVQQVPLIQRIGEANEQKVVIRYLDRDANKDLSEQLTINGGARVPTAIFMSEDFEFCALAGDRTLSRYRAIAGKQLGAACSTGIVPPDQSEQEQTLQDWLNEFERVQLMLRLSPRLRQKYGD